MNKAIIVIMGGVGMFASAIAIEATVCTCNPLQISCFMLLATIAGISGFTLALLFGIEYETIDRK